MTPSVCVVGSFMMDLVASAPRRPAPGETVVGTGFATYLGGKGFNQAIAAARAGARTSMIGRLGDDDHGAAFRRALRAEGVDDRGVAADGGEGTGVGLPVLEPGGQNSIIVIPRANGGVDAPFIRSHADLITSADVLLLQLELPSEAAVEAASVARAGGTEVVLNPAPMSTTAELRTRVDVLVPNKVELLALAGAADGASTEDAARRVRGEWSCDVVVTLGPAGALVVPNRGEVVPIPAVVVPVIDTIGAGDTFCAYLATGLATGLDIVDAARRANIAAAISVTRRGGAESAPSDREVDELSGSQPTASAGAT